MVRINDSLVIQRPVDVVFDYAADQRHEPSYNPAMTRCEKVTTGPIGVGTRFDSSLHTRGGEVPMSSEVLAYNRPRAVTTRTAMPGAVVTGTLSFTADSPTSTTMTWDWQMRPTGWLRLLAPLMVPLGRRFERRIWTNSNPRDDHIVNLGPTQPGCPLVAPSRGERPGTAPARQESTRRASARQRE